MKLEIHVAHILDFIHKADGSGVLIVNAEDQRTKNLIEDSDMILESNVARGYETEVQFSFDTPSNPRTY